MLCGGLTGALEASIINPFEVVKIAQQADKSAKVCTKMAMFQINLFGSSP